MLDSPAPIDPMSPPMSPPMDPPVCGMCGGTLLDRRFVHVDGPYLEILCSEPCLRAALREERRARWAARRLQTKRLVVGTILVAGFVTPHHGPWTPRRVARPRAAPVSSATDAPSMPPGWFGPEWPPTDVGVLAALGRDAWIHPLAGPIRRMPIRDTRVFGAVRPGNRAVECRNGHCGVDLGGEIWGEQVHAVHDGVVDYVQRGPNPDHGGEFVRLSHYKGAVFTQYFHLAAIPRGLERGMSVRGGDIIGLLGDTGVKESAPHLHFAVSVRPAKGWPERYIDPEPLIALWPLRVPLDGSEVGLVTTEARPGLPLGSAPLLAGRKRRQAKERRAAEPRSRDESGDESDQTKAAPADDESAPDGVAPETGTAD
jgi:murein DD-endopeptidase MepM/ murein hydrolase activator NlpD